jgi:hypothetical protein
MDAIDRVLEGSRSVGQAVGRSVGLNADPCLLSIILTA